MAKAFARLGYVNFESAINVVWDQDALRLGATAVRADRPCPRRPGSPAGR